MLAELVIACKANSTSAMPNPPRIADAEALLAKPRSGIRERLCLRSAKRDAPHFGPLQGEANRRRVGHSDLEFDANFQDLRARNLEVCPRPLRVVMHEGEDRLAPTREPGSPSGGDDRGRYSR